MTTRGTSRANFQQSLFTWFAPSPAHSLCRVRNTFFGKQGADCNSPLHKIATKNVGRALTGAVGKSGNEKLRAKVCTAITPEHAHVIDTRYHKRCRATEVTHVLCGDGRLLMIDAARAADKMLQELSSSVSFKGSCLMVTLSA